MPALYLKNYIHTTPTHLINGVKGWNSRLIYSYYGSPTNTLPYLEATGGDYSINIFEAIRLYTFPDTGGSPIYKGTNRFPPRYFSTGKNLRIKGSLKISTTGTAIFNTNISIYYPGLGTTSIANQNGGGNHTVANRDGVDDMPINFDITLTSIEMYDTVNQTNEVYMQANGHYQYAYSSFSTGGDNTDTVYVPIYGKNEYGPNKTPYILVADNFENPIPLIWSFTGSSNVDKIDILYITIEELS